MQIKSLATTSPAEQISLQEAKDYARVKSSTEDALIAQLIIAARQKAEQVLGRSLVIHSYMQEVTQHDGEIELLYPPIGTISKVEYFDGSAWNELTLDTEYLVKGLDNKYIEVSIAYQNVRVTFATTAFASYDIVRLMKELIVIYYDNRPDSMEQEKVIVNKLAKYKICQAI